MTIGKAFTMVDSKARVNGTIDYVLNFELPNTLRAAILRSPYAHAHLLKVDTSKAERLPGVAAVLSQNDLRGGEIDPYFGQVIRDQAPVAIDKVRFVGDPVAAVAAVDEGTAFEALNLIDIEYGELAAVFDPEEALRPGAPLLHEGPRRIIPGRPDVEARSLEGTNIVHLFKQRKGNLARGFRESELVFDNTFSSPPAQHVAMEPHVALADVSDGRITVWTCSQNPHTVQRQLSEIFKVPVSDVRIIVFTLGGGFGGKLNSKVEPLAALLAWKAGRPVKVSLMREEEFVLVAQHAAKVNMKTGVERDGTLVAVEVFCYYNSGAYADTTPNLITCAYAATGPYRVPHLYVDSYGVYTNTVPTAAFRGYGITQVAWAHESQMDIIADALNIDPLELRLKNILQKGDAFTTGEPMAEMYYPELLKSAAQRIGWKEEPLVVRDGNKIRAKGLSAIIKGMATPTTSTASVKLNFDGSLNVSTSTVEMGQGAKTSLAQIAADEAGVPLDKVRVSEPDTAFTPFDWMTASSRSTFCMGTAIRFAIQDIKAQLLEAAAEQLEAAKEDLVLETGGWSCGACPVGRFRIRT